MKTHFRFILLFLLSLGAWKSIFASAPATWMVGVGSGLSSISEALACARPGDQVIVMPGLYQEETLIIDKPLSLSGRPGAVLLGTEGREILVITADDVIVEGLTFQDLPHSFLKDLSAIRVQRCRRFQIRNNILLRTFFGIYLEYARQGQVIGNVLRSNGQTEAATGNGIHSWYCDSVLIEANEIRGHRDGIYLEFTHHSRIEDNLSAGNLRYGLHFMFSNDDLYRGNRFRDNGAGVAVMFSKRIDMLSNRFEHNWGRSAYGLLLKEISDARILENEFIQNTIGINIEGASRIEYRHNDFRRNGWAVKMTGGCLGNAFTQNQFAGNTLDLVVNSRANDNSFDGNYWSEYSGYDLDRDGFGDVPHRPVKLFSFLIDRAPESMVLLRSFFVDLLNFAEKVSPVLTPAHILDKQPRMRELPKFSDRESQGAGPGPVQASANFSIPLTIE